MAKNPTNEPVSIQLASSLSDQPNQLRHFIDVGPCYHLVRDKIWNQQTVSVFCDKSPVPDDQVIFEQDGVEVKHKAFIALTDNRYIPNLSHPSFVATMDAATNPEMGTYKNQ